MNLSIPILLYHSIDDKPVSPGYRPWALSTTQFEAQLDHLVNRGYTAITVTDLIHARAQDDDSLPPQPVVITFDDGLADFQSGALPGLQARNLVATLYVTTGHVGGSSGWLTGIGEGRRPMLDWDEIAKIRCSGIEIGAHSNSHVELDSVPRALAEREIRDSRAILEERIGCRIDSFAYPHGYHDRTVRQMVVDAGYSSACAVKNAASSCADDRFSLARLTITPDLTIDQFDDLLQGKGVAQAPRSERLQTKAWRLVRRSATRVGLRPQPFAGNRSDTTSTMVKVVPTALVLDELAVHLYPILTHW